MENDRAAATYITGIVRTVALIVLIAILAFFAIRWVRAGQEAKRVASSSEEVAVQEVDEDEGGVLEETQRVGVTESDDETEEVAESPVEVADLPSGIPQVGAENILVSALAITGLAYACFMYVGSRLALGLERKDR
jgi:hypothetical protein